MTNNIFLSWCPNTYRYFWRVRGFKLIEFSSSDFNVVVTREWSFTYYTWKKRRDTIVARYNPWETSRSIAKRTNRRNNAVFSIPALYVILTIVALTWSRRCSCDENRSRVIRLLSFSSPDCEALRSYIRIGGESHSEIRCYRSMNASEKILWCRRNRYRHFPDAYAHGTAHVSPSHGTMQC